MFACLDVGYRGTHALAACVVFAHWRAAAPLEICRAALSGVPDYHPGNFYVRELPPLLAVLERTSGRFETLVVDGYVWLGNGTQPGLGARLHHALGGRSAVIGVAKTRFGDDACSIPLYRGGSKRPLYITAAGIEPAAAAACIASMHGPNRIPALLALADAACRL